jgi:alpha-1,6-mannosyltransferase
VLLGLAVAVKIPALVVLPFAALAAVAGPYRFRALLRDGGWVTLGAVGAMLGTTLASGLGVGWIAGVTHTKDLVQFTSPPTAVGMTLTYAGRLIDPDFDAVPAARLVALLLLAVFLVVLWWRSTPQPEMPARAPLRGAALAMAATVVLAPSFHPWYATWPLVLLAAVTVRTDFVMAVSAAAAFLVLPDGSGLARFVKFPGAPLMTLFVVVLAVRYVRRLRTERAAERPAAATSG